MHEVLNGKTICKFLICLGILLLSSHSILATDYYFSASSGSDKYTLDESQSSLTPWRSIQKLNEISASLKAGDRVLFKRGDIFHGTIILSRGGTSGNPIFFDAYGTGEKPIITSLIKIETWDHIGDGVYRSKISDIASNKLKILLIDDELKEVGRFPNFDDGNAGYLTIKSLNNDLSINGKDIPFDANGGEIVIRKNQWIIDTYPIKQSKDGTVDYWNVGKSNYRPVEGFGYFIQNHVKTLDQFGEWSYSKDEKNLSIYFGDRRPSEASIEIATNDYLLVSNLLVHNLSFKNLHFKGANKNLINIEKSSNIVIDKCLLEYAGENAVYSFNTPDFTLTNNEIRYALSGAIFFWHGTPRSVILNNLIESSMPFQGMAKNSDLTGIGIYIAGDAEDSQIINNRIIDTGYSGIHFGGNNSVVKNNLVKNFCLWKQDGGGIYMNSEGLVNINNVGREIVGNIVLNGMGASNGTNEDYNIAEGIYLDDDTRGVKIEQNTVAHINGKGIYLHNANSVDIVGNLFFDCEVQLQLSHDILGNPIRDVIITNNQFSSTRDREIIFSVSSIKTDIDKIGFSSNNYFLNPYNREFIFVTKEPGYSYGKMRSFEDWSGTFGFEESSIEQQFSLSRYKILSEEIIKKIDFKADVKAISGTYNASSSWVGTSYNNGLLKVTPNSSKEALIYIQIGQIASEEIILVEMDVQSESENQTIEIFLEKTFNINQDLAISYFNSSPKGESVSIFLKSLVETNQESVVFRIPSNLQPLLIDNIKIAKITREENINQFFFRFNYSEEIASFPLIGIYKNANGQVFKDSISINPFRSVLLVKVD
ncbi:right-handed parallel beta-helix repeat-containing protein [Algoriphagus antarcticus]|uniref:Parallel beta helix pectate lyase-like protein n=1 Tax=Algoriphagus antarcticus TaxID=238540 RepID=A0A3E0DFU7_9BACT|nr:right-handed parallel beta-helix repeat-containing protein [Algoriphagus antarcticus]REG81419.1 parallel beta helix pectate lyase-like protein [Algoriphagus antarcticus]